MTRNWAKWPTYSKACQRDVTRLLQRGGSLSAYRSSPQFPFGPRQGSWAARFEDQARRLANVCHVIATNSGTMALHAALSSLKLKPHALVLTTPFTFSATPAAILHAKYRPVFGDVDPRTFCLNALEGPQDEAVVPVDLFGGVASHDWQGRVIADSCQAVGAYAGMRGADAVVWSMNGQKNIPAGEAGAVLTNDDEKAQLLRRFISHGENWGGSAVGYNGRLNELTACVAYHGLLALPRTNATRQRLARALAQALKGEDRIYLPRLEGNEWTHAFYVYPLLVRDGVNRQRFVKILNSLGVHAGEGYIRPHLAHYPAFKTAYRVPLPVADDLSEKSLVILYGIRSPATVATMRYIALAIRAALDARPLRGRRLPPIEQTAF